MEAQLEYVHVAHTFFFARSRTDLHAQSVLIGKISASELRRKLCQECVVGWVLSLALSLSLLLLLCKRPLIIVAITHLLSKGRGGEEEARETP